jgi:outer membrane protein
VFAGVNLSWTVWDWGLVRDQVAQAESQASQLAGQKEKVALGVTLDVRSRYLTLLGAQASLDVAKKSIESAKENLRITETRFEAKAATTTDLLDAQVLLTRAAVSEISARYDYYIALAGLRKAMGEPVTDRYTAAAKP